MTKLLMTVCAALCSVVPAPAPAHEILLSSGAGLLANCTYRSSDASEVEHHLGLCLGYIKGVSNAYQIAEVLDLCPPASIDNEDLILSVVSRLKTFSPETMQLSSAEILKFVLADSFPCNGKKRTVD